MSRIVSQTHSYCPQCRTTHRADYVEESGQVWYVIHCPMQPHRTHVSSDAAIFQDIRRKAYFSQKVDLVFTMRRPFAVLEITNACNFDCPVCFAQSGTAKQDHLSLDEIRQRLIQLRDAGVRWVTLSGGDPTMHPQLEQIMTITRREFGLRPILLTNGLRLAEEPDFARQLKRLGLKKVQLQFDTINNDTYRLLRGRHDVQEKYNAIENIKRAGLRLGLIATITRQNLSELGDIMAFGVSLSPMLNSMVFQSVVPIGRYPSHLEILDREALINNLVEQCGQHDIHTSDFWPMPPMPVWGMAVHPDCPVNLHLLVKDGHAHAMGRTVDFDQFYTAMGKRLSRGRFSASLQPILQLMRSAQAGRRVSLLRHLYGLARGRGRYGLIWLSVGGYMNQATRDDGRLKRCPVCSVTASGLAGVCERSCNGENRPVVVEEFVS